MIIIKTAPGLIYANDGDTTVRRKQCKQEQSRLQNQETNWHYGAWIWSRYLLTGGYPGPRCTILVHCLAWIKTAHIEFGWLVGWWFG